MRRLYPHSPQGGMNGQYRDRGPWLIQINKNVSAVRSHFAAGLRILP